MPASRRLALITLVLLVVAFAAPALAVDETSPSTTQGATDSTVTEEQAVDVAPPAVTVPPEEPGSEVDDWTYRFLIPTLIALAALVVIMTTVQYFLQVVRKRYKVIE